MCTETQNGRHNGNPGYNSRRAGEFAARRFILCAVLFSLPGGTGNPVPAAAQTPQKKIPQNMFPVKPVASDPAPPAPSLGISNGQFFSYALPPGWRVGENGQLAL